MLQEINFTNVVHTHPGPPVSTSEAPNGTAANGQQEWHRPDHLTWYIAEDLPEKYAPGVTGAGKESRDRAYGYQSLGRLISAEDQHWDSSWTEVDLWLLNQLRISPLRVEDESAADIVIVPAIFEIHGIAIQVGIGCT